MTRVRHHAWGNDRMRAFKKLTVAVLASVFGMHPAAINAQGISLSTISSGADQTRSLFVNAAVASGYGAELGSNGYIPYFYTWSLASGYQKTYLPIPPGSVLPPTARDISGSDNGRWAVVNYSSVSGGNLVVRYDVLAPGQPEFLGDGLAFGVDDAGRVAGMSPLGLPGFFDVGSSTWTQVQNSGFSGLLSSAVSAGGQSLLGGTASGPSGLSPLFLVNGVQQSVASWHLPAGGDFVIQSISSNGRYVGLSIDGLLWVVDRSSGRATQLLDFTGAGIYGVFRDISDFGTAVGDDSNTGLAFGWAPKTHAAPFRQFVQSVYGFNIGFDPLFVDALDDNGVRAAFALTHSFDLLEGPSLRSLSSDPDDIVSDPVTTPEPMTFVLVGSGLIGIGTAARRQKKQALNRRGVRHEL